ncbi:hypothetical protein NDN08_000927 [Rhodosorus marinus]|uniref:CR-type domain-containing protein n=1 Tax=Rhodosorus marinus TaxID=101924 RepID=A0AAV8UPL7_9RHOD|nr:hypothetical protein NDN08_000927 [Rhodosorus marinus]
MLLFVEGAWVAKVTGRRLCVCSGKGFGKQSTDESNQPPKGKKGKKVKIVPCEDCQGTGKFLCPICRGSGEMVGFTQTIPEKGEKADYVERGVGFDQATEANKN